MAAPTADEILELYDDLNFPSASKLRAALLKKGFRARMKDVESFVKAQTPAQLFAKGPKYRGHIISSRVNERWVIDFIDFQAEPDGDLKYILMAQDIHNRKMWANALAEKTPADYIGALKDIVREGGKPKEVNFDVEVPSDHKIHQRALSMVRNASNQKIDATLKNQLFEIYNLHFSPRMICAL